MQSVRQRKAAEFNVGRKTLSMTEISTPSNGSLSVSVAQVNNRPLWNPQAIPSTRLVTVYKPATHHSTQCHISIYASQNKQRLFPYILLTDWFL